MLDINQRKLEFELWKFYKGSQKVGGDEITRYVSETAGEMLDMMMDIWLVETEVVKRYPFSLEWLRRSRKKRKGPPFYKLHGHRNGKVVYRVRDLEDYMIFYKK